MKHKSEDISRLDGDIYENINGDSIDISKIVCVSDMMLSGPYKFPGKPFYIVTFEHNSMSVVFDDGDSTMINEKEWADIRRDQYDINRIEFISIWKQWKRLNK